MRIYVVKYDDGSGLQFVYSQCEECKGALAVYCDARPIVGFHTAAEAKKAIRISKLYAELCKARGGSYDDAFTTYLRYVHVVPLVVAPPENAGEHDKCKHVQ